MKSIASMLTLRDTTVWPGYREARPIPLRFGPCGGEALQYDASRTLWVWNDAASAGIHRVDVGDQRVTNWEFGNAPDVTGKPVAFIKFSEPVPEGRRVIARGRGALHPVAGGLMTNPADVLWDILANRGGLRLPAARLAAFRQQTVDLPIGGSIEQSARLYEIARSICSSIGAICSADLLGFAQLWPEFDQPAATLIGPGPVEVGAVADLADVCTDLTLRYAIEAGTPRGAVQYVVRRPMIDAQPQIVDAPWITSARVAALVCERLLRLRARTQYVVDVRDYRGALRVGQAVELAHPQLPVEGVHTVLQRDTAITDEGPVTSFSLRAPVGPVPLLSLVRNTNASEPRQTVELVADQLGDEFVVDIVDDETGDPMPNAECTLDGVVTRRADSAGTVKFPSRYATRGEHTIVAVAPGHGPQTIIVTVR